MARSGCTTVVHGVDFTSAPRRAKPVVVASGQLRDGTFVLREIEALASYPEFERWLRRPGPWVGGFDFPFGLPRQALLELGWPLDWRSLTQHCRGLGRESLRRALDAHRAGRPVGSKFCYRAGDGAAGSHSPLKLVNPPVALMFLEGAPRLVEAGVTVPGLLGGDPERVALEAYPGYAVRRLLGARTRVSYKNDARGKQTAAQQAVRRRLVTLLSTDGLNAIRLRADAGLVRGLVDDASGDRLDAVLCALQAAWGWQRRAAGFGLPAAIDPVEGWIVSVPDPRAAHDARGQRVGGGV